MIISAGEKIRSLPNKAAVSTLVAKIDIFVDTLAEFPADLRVEFHVGIQLRVLPLSRGNVDTWEQGYAVGLCNPIRDTQASREGFTVQSLLVTAPHAG